MANRELTSFTEPTLSHSRDVIPATIKIERLASGAPGLMVLFQIDESEQSIVIPDGVAFLAPVVRWLGGEKAVTAPTVSETVARATEIGKELQALDKAILEGRIAFTNESVEKTRMDYYDTDLFNILGDRREELRKELLTLTSTKKE